MNTVDRFIWLILVPTASCIAPWVLLGIASQETLATAHYVSASLPLIGVFGVLGYRRFTRDYVHLPLYYPFAVGAVIFAPAMVDLAVDISRDPDGNWIPLLPYGVGFLLPFLAFGCGAAAFIRVGPRNPV